MTLSDTMRTAVTEAYAAYFRTPTSAQKSYAKEILKDPVAPATAVLIAARHLLGPTFTAYEPETLWLELSNICPINRDKLMAGIALAMTPSFYWDYRVFGATVHALNDEMVVPEIVPRCTAPQMTWGVFEAELLFALTDGESTRPEFDESLEAYVAVSLLEEGCVVPPVGLSFCYEELKRKISPDSQILREETEKAWAELPKEKLDPSKFKDDALGAQLLKLTDSWLYAAEKTAQLRSYLAKI